MVCEAAAKHFTRDCEDSPQPGAGNPVALVSSWFLTSKMVPATALLLLILAPLLLAQEPGCGTDEKGVARSPGTSWKEDCNNCRCGGAGVKVCTKRFCLGDNNFTEAEEDQGNKTHIDVVVLDTGVKGMAANHSAAQEDPSSKINFGPDAEGNLKAAAAALFNVEAADVSATPQCKQAGVQDCKKISFNPASLADIKPGDKIQLTPGGIELTFRSLQNPSSTAKSYDFLTPGGLEALFTVTGGSAARVTGSVHHNGRIYVVEPCGDGCMVLYYRDQSFFENLKD